MKKVVKEYNVYKFEELEKDIQEKLLEKYMQNEQEIYCECLLEYDMRELAKDLLQEYFKGAEFKRVFYDLSYCQGSGAMIEFTIDLKDLNNKYKMLTNEEVKKCSDIGYTNIKVYHNNSHYYHERTFDIDWNDYTDNDNFEEIQNKIDTTIDLFKNDIVEMNQELTKSGYEQLENEEYFKENARIVLNDLEFLENGDVF